MERKWNNFWIWMPVTAALVLLLGAVNLRADAANRRTLVTFSAPVEVGGVALPSGTYQFRLMDNGPRTLVGIWNEQNGGFVSLVMGVPDFRLVPADHPIIRLAEAGRSSPPAVRAWFYPGSQYGLEFVYPYSQALRMARASGRAVLAMPELTRHTPSALASTPIARVTPAGRQQPSSIH